MKLEEDMSEQINDEQEMCKCGHTRWWHLGLGEYSCFYIEKIDVNGEHSGECLCDKFQPIEESNTTHE